MRGFKPIAAETSFSTWMEGHGTYSDDRIIFSILGVEYVVDAVDRPRYFTAYKLIEEKPLKVGSLGLTSGRVYGGKMYLDISSVDVHKKHRREHIAQNLYLAALRILKQQGYGGLLSRDEDVAAKKFVKAVRQRFNAYNPDPDNPGLWLIDAR